MLGAGTHQLGLRWHLTPELSLNATEGPFFSVRNGSGIALFPSAVENWSKSVARGAWSPVYGIKESADVVHFTTVAVLPSEFATLLKPISISPEDANERAQLIRVSCPPEISVYRFVDNGEAHCFIFAQDKSWTSDEWKSDAEFMYSCSINGKLNLLVFCNGTHVEFRGNKLVSSPKCIHHCEIISSHGKTKIVCSDHDIVISQEGLSKSFEAGETVPQGSDEAGR